jgi:hypothetical protein
MSSNQRHQTISPCHLVHTARIDSSAQARAPGSAIWHMQTVRTLRQHDNLLLLQYHQSSLAHHGRIVVDGKSHAISSNMR